MVTNAQEKIQAQFSLSSQIFSEMANDTVLIQTVQVAANACAEAINAGGKILLVGNGGSAADAQHIAAEFVNYFGYQRKALPALALTTDTSVLTSISNDSDFKFVFSRQIEALGNPEDILIAYSTSGNSENIINAIQAAKSNGLKTIGMTGSKPAKFSGLVDYLIQIPSAETPKIQEGHLVIGHIISGLVEAIVAPK